MILIKTMEEIITFFKSEDCLEKSVEDMLTLPLFQRTVASK